MELTDTEIHLWLTDLQAVDDQWIPAYRQLMNGEELARNQRYRFDRGQFADCVTRALARTVLSTYADVEPAAWQFSKGRHGKPEISAPPSVPPLRFNLSHTRHYVVCAVCLEYDMGVDIESTQRGTDVLNIADRYFSNREVEDLFALPEDRQYDRFFDYWTLKEAYMKARGEGISLGLGNFSFQLPETGDITVTFSAQIDDDPTQWLFRVLAPRPDHRLALALRKPGADALKLRFFETVPLSGISEELPIAERH